MTEPYPKRFNHSAWDIEVVERDQDQELTYTHAQCSICKIGRYEICKLPGILVVIEYHTKNLGNRKIKKNIICLEITFNAISDHYGYVLYTVDTIC